MDGMKLGCETPQVPSPEAVGFLVNSRSISGRSSSFRGEIPSKMRQDFGLVNSCDSCESALVIGESVDRGGKNIVRVGLLLNHLVPHPSQSGKKNRLPWPFLFLLGIQ